MHPFDLIHNFLDQTRDASTRAAEVETIRRLILGPGSQAPEQAWQALRTVYLDAKEAAEVRQAAAAALRRISRVPDHPLRAEVEALLTQESGLDLSREPGSVLAMARVWQELSVLDLLLLPGPTPRLYLTSALSWLRRAVEWLTPLAEPGQMVSPDPRLWQTLVRQWQGHGVLYSLR